MFLQWSWFEDGLPLVAELLVALAQDVSSNVRLEERDDASQTLVTPVLQSSQHARLEKHLQATA